MDLFTIFIKAFLIDNIVLMSFLGLCPFIGMSADQEKAVGMGLAVTLVTVLGACVTWPVYTFVLAKLNLVFLKQLAFILIIATLVQMGEFFLKKVMPGLYRSMGIFFALLTTNCAILAVALNNISREYTFIQAAVYSLGVSLGFLVALILLTGIRRRIRTSPVPAFLKGSPILLIAAGLMSVAFMGFSGLVK